MSETNRPAGRPRGRKPRGRKTTEVRGAIDAALAEKLMQLALANRRLFSGELELAVEAHLKAAGRLGG